MKVGTKNEVFFSVDPDLIAYIHETENYKNQFSSLIDKHDVEFCWEKGNKLATIKYNGDYIEKTLETVQMFLERVVKEKEKDTKQEAFLAVDPDVIAYINETVNYKNQFYRLMEEQEVEFCWTKGKKFATIKYDGEYNKGNLMSFLETVLSFLETFVKNDIPVQKHIFKAVETEMTSYESGREEDPPKIQFFNDQLILRIIWRNTGSDYKTIIEEKLLKLSYDRLEFTRYEKEYIALLKKMAFVEKRVRPNCKDVEVDYDEDNIKVTLKGPIHQLTIAEDIFLEQEFATTEKSLNLLPNITKFLMTEEGKGQIEKVLKDHKYSVIKFESSEYQVSTKILGQCDEDLREAISGIAAEENIVVEECDITLKSRPEWIELCETTIRENGVTIRGKSRPVTSIVGFADAVKKAVTKLQDFVDTNLIRKDYVICQSGDVKQYIRQMRKEELRLIQEKQHQHNVKISDDEAEDDKFCISGRGEGLRQAKRELAQIIDKTVAGTFTIEQPGLRKTFESGRGENLANMVGTEHKCLVQIEKNFSQNFGGYKRRPFMSLADGGSDSTHAQFFTPQGQKISRKVGNIAADQVTQTGTFIQKLF